MNWNCRICNVEFVRDEVCVTCGAEKLYDATIKDLQAQVDELQKDLDLIMKYDSNLLDHLKGWK
jgi:hypothetical protein